MGRWLRKLLKGIAIAAATAVILLALAIGGFRLLVTQLPSYQGELQSWVNDELGFKLAFARIDARLGWRGPELTFHDATVAAADDAAPFLTARAARVGFSPFALAARLLARRKLSVDRLTFEGTELTLVKTADGAYRLQGAPAATAARGELALDVPPDVEVLVRDSRVVYLDQSRNLAWDFQEVSGSMRRDAGMLLLEARARPPSEFATSIEIDAQGSIVQGSGGTGPHFSGDWRVAATLDGVDLGVAARLVPTSAVVPQAGRGDVSVWVEWQRGTPQRGTVELALADVALPSVFGTASSRFDRIAFTADWERADADWRITLHDVMVARAGRSWPMAATAELEVARDDAGLKKLTLSSDFVRLEDLTPFFAPLPESRVSSAWFSLAPRGDLRAADLELTRTAEGVDYVVAAQFEGLGVGTVGDAPGFTGVTGEVRADSRGGRVEFRSAGTVLDWPSLFRAPLGLEELSGIVVWREGQDAVRVVSDDLVVATRDASTRSSLELTIPRDGTPPRLDLETGVSGFDLTAVSRYLPARKMPANVVGWIDNALRGGRVRGAEITFVGAPAAFPFDARDGRFHAAAEIENGALAFIRDWPIAEELTGSVEFTNAGFAAHGSGRVLGNRTAEVRVAIPDLRQAVLTVQAATIGPLDQVLAFLQGAPLIARHLGPDFARLNAPNGTGEVNVDLTLPLRDRNAYDLTATLGIIDGELAFRGFGPHATEIQGNLELDGGTLHGENIDAIFLDGPIVARVDTPDAPGYRSRLTLEGEVTIDAVAAAFNLPFADRLAGQTTWQGTLLIPAAEQQPSPPSRITVDTNLSGVALRFPEPFAKAPAEPTNLQIDMAFTAGGGLQMQGYLGAPRRFALEFDPDPNGAEGKFRFRRAALRFGGALPELRLDRGVTVDGTLAVLRVDDWLPLSRGSGNRSQWSGAFAGAALDVTDFSAFGQQLGATKIDARRRTDDWQIDVDSAPVSGTLLVPADLASDPQVVAVMRRLYLSAGNGEGGPARNVDPRQLPGLQLHADAFAIGSRRLGKLDAEILSDPLGLRLVSFESASESFGAQGSGGWFTGGDGDTTRFAVSLSSTDVAKTLDELGFDPVIEGETAEVTASVYWPGAPTDAWMQHVSGDLALRATKGSLLDVQPGAGRVVGLLSISALPRRLALDFRDVFNRGLVFDEITADFFVLDGNAYTDNLKLTGPAAEIGVIGRTGLRDRDYGQQAVVTAEPGKMLPTVGGLLGGPGVAAALLIFTRIFKKPLQGIGRASYCVTGSWQEPMVERLTPEQLEQGEICAELPPNAPNRAAEAVAR